MSPREQRPLPTKRDEAAGGVVASRDAGALRVVLIAVGRDGDLRWSLPKGHFKKSETVEQAARREVEEETGLRVEIVEKLATIDYWFVERSVRYHKFVYYYLMRAVGGDFGDHDHEVVDVRWFGWDEALRRMAYANERRVLETERDRVERLL